VNRREMRIYQAKRRGSKRSYKTELENVLILLAWEAAALSEGQVSSLLGVDRVEARIMRERAIKLGVQTFSSLRPPPKKSEA
jgi:hypothetical protein